MLALLVENSGGKKYPAFLAMDKIVAWLMAPATFPVEAFSKAPTRARNALLANSFNQAMSSLLTAMGSDIENWQYGQVTNKHIQIAHPLAGLVDAKLQAQLNIGPSPKGGSVNTVNLAGFDHSGNLRVGPSFRMIVDTSDWDLTVGTNSPGQSGDSRDPHYRDLFSPWRLGEYFPAYYSREKIEDNASLIMTLSPLK